MYSYSYATQPKGRGKRSTYEGRQPDYRLLDLILQSNQLYETIMPAFEPIYLAAKCLKTQKNIFEHQPVHYGNDEEELDE